MSTKLRHTQLANDWKDARTQLHEDLRDVDQALSERVIGRMVTIAAYTATGATTTRIQLGRGTDRAVAAILVRVALTHDAAADVSVSPRLNFYETADGLGVYEPSGLTAYTQYDLTFLVLE